MIYVECTQGDEVWQQTRIGLTTASRAKDACDRLKNGEMSAKALGYAAEVAMERVCGDACDDAYVNFAMRRGVELEPHARISYEAMTGNLAQEAGIFLTDDRVFGYSSDGLIDDDGLLEIKCPLSPLTVVTMWRTQDIADYRHQIQFGMWLTGRKWLDFVMYDPRLEAAGNAVFLKRIKRDDDFIEIMEGRLVEFMRVVDEFETTLRRKAA